MGRVIGMALCENIPLGIPVTSAFCKLLSIDGFFSCPPNLVCDVCLCVCVCARARAHSLISECERAIFYFQIEPQLEIS